MFRLILLVLAISLTAAGQDPLLTKAQRIFKPVPESPPALRANPLTPEKIDLGRLLYFDPRLSSSWLISCNTCHNVGLV